MTPPRLERRLLPEPLEKEFVASFGQDRPARPGPVTVGGGEAERRDRREERDLAVRQPEQLRAAEAGIPDRQRGLLPAPRREKGEKACHAEAGGTHRVHGIIVSVPETLATAGARVSYARTPIRVLFLCTANSARSQIAEALLRHGGGGRVEAASAGARPADKVHPAALGVLAKHGIPPPGCGPRASGDLLGRRWDIVITVCDQAREACPVLPGTLSVHWGMPDPAAAAAADEAEAFGEAFRTLRRRIDAFLALPLEELGSAALRRALREVGP